MCRGYCKWATKERKSLHVNIQDAWRKRKQKMEKNHKWRIGVKHNREEKGKNHTDKSSCVDLLSN